MKYLIGTDNGGTATKAALFDQFGREIAVAQAPTPILTPHPEWVERDMMLLWQTTAGVIREVIQKSGISPQDIAAVGCTGHGKGLYLWGKNNQPAYRAIASTDNRAADLVSRWQQEGITKKAWALTHQNMLSCQPAPLLRWMKENNPDVYANIRYVLEAKDYIRFMLTGEVYAEMTDISGTSLINLETRQYDARLLEWYGIPEVAACLPPLVQSHQVCGHVTARAAQETGLPEGIAVCGGMFDIDACAVAMQVTQEGRLCAITGTWSINEYCSRTMVLEEPTTMNSLFCLPEYYLIEESSPTSAGNLEWVIDTFFAGLGLFRGELYRKANQMVADCDPAASNVLFLPFLYGSNVPGVKGGFLGLDSSYQLSHLVRAVFEGVVFSHKSHIDKLLRHAKTPFSCIRLSGGACNSPVWVQLFADVLQMPVELVKTRELGTLGAAIAAAIAGGLYPDYEQATAHMCGAFETVLPNAALREVYAAKYRHYQETCNRLAR